MKIVPKGRFQQSAHTFDQAVMPVRHQQALRRLLERMKKENPFRLGPVQARGCYRKQRGDEAKDDHDARSIG